ncbi:FAD-binding domain-containing protein [Rhizodiscina lignyota]|uniref:FAD-binding domain-containing protein n=1 Tax=Rhizodiscina lignyota TaxID=1504668 RepID=A0A9P4IQU1_9PEZI|nr:FAD-binding domain-containing protein [Rhizodiscina lignyota]
MLSSRRSLILLLSIISFAVASSSIDLSGLLPQLSPHASVTDGSNLAAQRWTEFDSPTPGATVNVATEQDVLVTVQYCIRENIEFLSQNGGHGWSTTIHLKQNGIIINLGALNDVTFNKAKTEVTVLGGALVSDVVAAQFANQAIVATGTCNCVGALGSALGGGLGNLQGKLGLISDSIISLNVVTASGKSITVTEKDFDLWWALRGSAANFAIVTSVIMRSHPVEAAGLTAWTGPLIFAENKLEELVQAVDELFLKPEMSVSLVFVSSGPPNNTAQVIASVFFYGTEEEGRQAFAPLYKIGPLVDGTTIQPVTRWNDANNSTCVKGERKQTFGAGLARMVPATWREIYKEFQSFIQLSGSANSSVVVNADSLVELRQIPEGSSSFPFRNTINFHAFTVAWYADPALDHRATAYGSNVRDLWRSTSGLKENSTYINNAYGDEALEVVYGHNLERLKALKRQFDPYGRFTQWFSLAD